MRVLSQNVDIDECVYVFVMFVHEAVCVNTINGDNPVCSYVCACMSLDLIIAIIIRRQLQCVDLDLTFS